MYSMTLVYVLNQFAYDYDLLMSAVRALLRDNVGFDLSPLEPKAYQLVVQ